MSHEPLLKTISDRYIKILQGNLVGIYIHGSIAFRCFNWDKSDIDFIVVVDSEITQQTKLDLLDVLEELRSQAPSKGFEMSVVQKKYCKHFIYPTPYQLHYSNGWLDRYLENPLTLCTGDYKTDPDLAAHFTVIKHVGIVLCGQPISTVFGNVPKKDYIESIRLDIQDAENEVLNNPVYIVLNLCRVYAYLMDDLVLSKEEGGRWGLLHLPELYSNIITESLNNYSFSNPLCLDDESRICFCNYMLKNIFNPIL